MGCGTPWIWRGTPRIVHLLRKTTSHATSQAKPARSRAVALDTAPCNLAGKACSVTGCRPIKSKIPTISCVSKLPPKWREFYFLHVPSSKPCNLASAPLRLGHGLLPYKKAKKQIFLRERAPDEICFYLFCMACSFREKSACIMEKGMVD